MNSYSSQKVFGKTLKKAITQMKKLLDILPVYGVEHDAILSKMGDITVAFKVELPELFTMSNEDYKAFHHSWSRQ